MSDEQRREKITDGLADAQTAIFRAVLRRWPAMTEDTESAENLVSDIAALCESPAFMGAVQAYRYYVKRRDALDRLEMRQVKKLDGSPPGRRGVFDEEPAAQQEQPIPYLRLYWVQRRNGCFASEHHVRARDIDGAHRIERDVLGLEGRAHLFDHGNEIITEVPIDDLAGHRVYAWWRDDRGILTGDWIP